jgi:curved DNA-binding protein CbpA
MSTDYFAVLGVEPGCSTAELKRAYHRLALKYHPDRNPDPEAVSKFQQIQEAYDILSEPSKNGGFSSDVSPQQTEGRYRDPAYRKKSKPFRGSAEKEEEELNALIQRSLPILGWLPKISLSLLLFLAIDYSLPPKLLKDQIIDRFALRNTFTIKTRDGHSFDFSLPNGRPFLRNDDILITVSPIFSILRSVSTGDESYQLPRVASVFGSFSFAPILLAIFSFLGLRSLWEVQVLFKIHVATALLLVLNLSLFALSVW